MTNPSPLQPSSGNIAHSPNNIPVLPEYHLAAASSKSPTTTKSEENLNLNSGIFTTKKPSLLQQEEEEEEEEEEEVLKLENINIEINKDSGGSEEEEEEEDREEEEEEEEEIPPPYLQNLTEKDAQTLKIPDDQFTPDSWDMVKKRVLENKLDEFKRVPSQLRQYLEYTWSLKQSPVYGGVRNFILRERLGWDLNFVTAPPDAARDSSVNVDDLNVNVNGNGNGHVDVNLKDIFANSNDDVNILQNDWPYGIDERIVHLVVWTKFPLEDDPVTGDLKSEVRRQVDDFVRRTFTRSRCGSSSSSSSEEEANINIKNVDSRDLSLHPKAPDEDSVIWFKNWTSIKSIHSVEHFHVMLFDPDPEFVDQVTGGDIPLWKKRRGQK